MDLFYIFFDKQSIKLSWVDFWDAQSSFLQIKKLIFFLVYVEMLLYPLCKYIYSEFT